MAQEMDANEMGSKLSTSYKKLAKYSEQVRCKAVKNDNSYPEKGKLTGVCNELKDVGLTQIRQLSECQMQVNTLEVQTGILKQKLESTEAELNRYKEVVDPQLNEMWSRIQSLEVCRQKDNYKFHNFATGLDTPATGKVDLGRRQQPGAVLKHIFKNMEYYIMVDEGNLRFVDFNGAGMVYGMGYGNGYQNPPGMPHGMPHGMQYGMSYGNPGGNNNTPHMPNNNNNNNNRNDNYNNNRNDSNNAPHMPNNNNNNKRRKSKRKGEGNGGKSKTKGGNDSDSSRSRSPSVGGGKSKTKGGKTRGNDGKTPGKGGNDSDSSRSRSPSADSSRSPSADSGKSKTQDGKTRGNDGYDTDSSRSPSVNSNMSVE